MNEKELKQIMDNPDRRYALYPIIHQRICDTSLADEKYEQGFAGVVGNIAYKRGFDTDEKCWSDAEAGFKKYKDLGLNTWIYDEEGYPSGSAGGYLCEDNPEFIAKGLYCYQSWRPLPAAGEYRSSLPDGELWRAVLASSDGKEIIDITHTKNEHNVLYFDIPKGGWWLIILMKRRLYDGVHNSESYASPRDYINLTDRKATEKFIEMTHENYKKHLNSEFGKSIVATFTDEPSLVSWYNSSGTHPLLTWQEDFPEKFMLRYGYDILEAIVAVLKDGRENGARLRCDYWEFIANETSNNFFKPIQDWCHKNNLKSSGHLLGEEQLSFHILAYGSFYRSMKFLDWPGIDQLHAEPELLIDERNIPFARFVASFADISGENEVFTEFSDHSIRMNEQKAPKDYYYGSVNWHLAMGINNFTSYFSFNGFTNEDILMLNKYTSRMNQLMHKGFRDSDTAVLYPECDMWAAMLVRAEGAWSAGGESFRKVHNNFSRLTWELLYRNVDWDCIDDELLIKSEIKNGALYYKNRKYKNLVLPSVTVIRDKAAEKIIKLANSGIGVYILGAPCEISRETGKESDYKKEITRLIDEGKIYASEDIFRLLENFTGGKLCTKNRHTSLMTHCRITEDGTRIVFLTNTSMEALKETLTVREKCRKLYLFDAESGKVSLKDFTENAEGVSFEISIEPLKAYIYILEK